MAPVCCVFASCSLRVAYQLHGVKHLQGYLVSDCCCSESLEACHTFHDAVGSYKAPVHEHAMTVTLPLYCRHEHVVTIHTSHAQMAVFMYSSLQCKPDAGVFNSLCMAQWLTALKLIMVSDVPEVHQH